MSLQLESPKLTGGHSSDVRMHLHLGERSFPVLQASKVALKLADVSEVNPGDGEFEISVDGHVRRQPIRVLAEGWRGNWIAIEDR